MNFSISIMKPNNYFLWWFRGSLIHIVRFFSFFSIILELVHLSWWFSFKPPPELSFNRYSCLCPHLFVWFKRSLWTNSRITLVLCFRYLLYKFWSSVRRWLLWGYSTYGPYLRFFLLWTYLFLMFRRFIVFFWSFFMVDWPFGLRFGLTLLNRCWFLRFHVLFLEGVLLINNAFFLHSFLFGLTVLNSSCLLMPVGWFNDHLDYFLETQLFPL